MITARTIARFHPRFSSALLHHSAMIQAGFTSKLHTRFVSSIMMDADAGGKVDVAILRRVARNLNQTGLKPEVFDVGNNHIQDALTFPSADSHVLDGLQPVSASLYEKSDLRTRNDSADPEKATDIDDEAIKTLTGVDGIPVRVSSVATVSNKMSMQFLASIYWPEYKTDSLCIVDFSYTLSDTVDGLIHWSVQNNALIRTSHLGKDIFLQRVPASATPVTRFVAVVHLMEVIGDIQTKNWDYCSRNSPRSIGNTLATVSRSIVQLMQGSATPLCGQRDIRACDISCRPNMRTYPQIAGTCREHGLQGGRLPYGVGNYFGAACRIVHKQIVSKPTSIPSSLPNYMNDRGFQFANCICPSYCKQPIKQFTRNFATGSRNMREEGKGTGKARIYDTNLRCPNPVLREVGERNSKPRNHRQATAYSKMTFEEAQIRLGVRLSLPGIPVEDMLERKDVLLEPRMVLEIKRETYKGLTCFLNIEGYPDGSSPDFKEGNINDLVAFTLLPILDLFKSKSMCNVLLVREKETISKAKRMRGMAQFIMRDYISLMNKRYVVVVESKWEAHAEARKQCFLALRDMRDNNGGGTVYGFVTTGEYWSMITFNGQFRRSQMFPLLFETMSKHEQKWLADYSVLVDCFHVALTNARQDLVDIVDGCC